MEEEEKKEVRKVVDEKNLIRDQTKDNINDGVC